VKKKLLTWAPPLLAVIGAVVHAGRFDFVCDDAYISFRYAENLARHGALVWNIGERVEGYTNFLWTVFLAGCDVLGLSLPAAALWLGRFFGGLSVIMIYLIGLQTRSPRALDKLETSTLRAPLLLIAPALAAACAAFACWSSGGLETQAFTFFSVAGFAVYLHEERTGAPIRLSAAVMALAAMTRPEGVLLFAWMTLHRTGFSLVELIGESRRPEIKTQAKTAEIRPKPRKERPAGHPFWRILRRELIWGGLFLVLYGSYFLWRWHYYGYLFPNTYYVKSASSDAAETHRLGWAYLTTFVDYYGLRHAAWAPLVGLGCAVYAALRKPHRYLVLFSWLYWLGAAALLGGWIVHVGGDFMAMHRFWVPVIPYLALMVGDAIYGVGDELARVLGRFRNALRIAAPMGAAAIGAFLVGAVAVRSYDVGHRTLHELTVTRRGYHGSHDHMESVAFMRKFARDRVLIGRWLRRRVPADAWIAVGGAGAIVYASGLRAIDTFGLSDLHVAHNVKPRSARPGHQKLAPLRYILRRRPDIICSPHVTRMQDWEYRPRRSEKRRWETRGYQYFCATPAGLNPSHYCCLMRVDRDLGLTPVSAYRYH
jgi:arabinofuranosyltransferase